MKEFAATLFRWFHSRLGILFPNLAVVGLFPVSCLSTWTGLYGYLCSAQQGELWQAALVASGITLGIQVLLLELCSRGVNERSSRRRLFSTLLYVAVAALSVTFSFSFYFRLSQADEFARKDFTQKVGGVLGKTRGLSSQLRSSSRLLERLAEYSEKQAMQELNFGGTCDDVGGGTGPREKGRTEDAELFREYREDFQALVQNFQARVESLEESISTYQPGKEPVRPWFERARRIGGEISGIRTEALHVINSLQTYLATRGLPSRYGFVDEETGHFVLCRDTRIQSFGEQIFSLELSELAPMEEPFNPEREEDILAHSLESILNVLAYIEKSTLGLTQAAQSLAKPEMREKSSSADLTLAKPPVLRVKPFDLCLFMGFLVDGLIFVAVRISGKRRQASKLGLLHRRELKRRIVQLLSADGQSPKQGLLNAWAGYQKYHCRRGRESDWLVVPHGFFLCGPEERALWSLSTILDGEMLEREACAIGWQRLRLHSLTGLIKGKLHSKLTQKELKKELWDVYRLDPMNLRDFFLELLEDSRPSSHQEHGTKRV